MSKNTKGFTLVETLIAVAILMVAIAGPLTIANQSLTAALTSRNAMIATYLAQDGMETLRNIKDNEIVNDTYGGWLNALNYNSCSKDSNASVMCTTPDKLNGSIVPQVCSSCQLYVDTGKYNYTYDSSYTRTPFKRYYYLTHVNAGSPSEAVVTVVVSWSDGSVPNQIQLQELMTNAPR
jgi:prepilin-type N-terminal cleavage/methylation domain-containing protein